MKRFQYKDQYNKNYKKIGIVLFVLIFILFLMLISLSIIKNNAKQDNTDNISKNKTIKEIVIEYGNKYISEKNNQTNGYEKNIYVELNTLPYDGDESNEEYYMNFLNDLARAVYYKNYFIFDQKNDYTIEVICKNNAIYNVIINDIEFYFQYMDAQIDMKNYEKIPETEMNVQSQLLNELIRNNWNKDIYFGTKDSLFNRYNIFFDEGIKVRIIKDNVYNVVFTKNYKENVVNDIFCGVDFNTIKAKMGEPSFEDKEKGVIGYKNRSFYIFFTENEISIYRNLDINIDEFFELVDKFISDEMDLKEFMNDLTYLWPDYSDYVYDNKSIFISYPLKGIEIKLNYDDISGILVYNNIKSILPNIKKYLNNSDFIPRLKLDSVFEAEKRRINENKMDIQKCNEYKETLKIEDKKKIGESFYYEYYPNITKNKTISKMKFISRHNDAPNRELNDRIDDFLWMNNDIFIYSKENDGIILYDLRNGEARRLVSGTDKFELNGIENNILKYDGDKTISISY